MDAIYTAVATATHGREGRAISSDGKLVCAGNGTFLVGGGRECPS